MTTVFQEDVIRRPYTVSLSTAARGLEVVSMADVKGIVFVVDDDVSVRESLELLIKTRRLAARHIRIRTASFSPALVPPFRAASCST